MHSISAPPLARPLPTPTTLPPETAPAWTTNDLLGRSKWLSIHVLFSRSQEDDTVHQWSTKNIDNVWLFFFNSASLTTPWRGVLFLYLLLRCELSTELHHRPSSQSYSSCVIVFSPLLSCHLGFDDSCLISLAVLSSEYLVYLRILGEAENEGIQKRGMHWWDRSSQFQKLFCSFSVLKKQTKICRGCLLFPLMLVLLTIISHRSKHKIKQVSIFF